MANQDDLQNLITKKAQDLHKEVLYFLELTEDQLTFETFERYSKMIEMLLEVRGINLDLITESHIKLMFIYYSACKLKKTGVIVDEALMDRIKKEKYGAFERAFYPKTGAVSSDDEDDDKDDIKLKSIIQKGRISSSPCKLFDLLLDGLATLPEQDVLTTNKCCIGSVK